MQYRFVPSFFIGTWSKIAQKNSKIGMSMSRSFDTSKIIGKIEDFVLLLERHCTVIHRPDCHEKDNSKKLYWIAVP